MLGGIKMSKLDIIVLDCVNKALDGKQDKLGDYVDPTKEQVKALFLELIGENRDTLENLEHTTPDMVIGRQYQNQFKDELRKKVSEL